MQVTFAKTSSGVEASAMLMSHLISEVGSNDRRSTSQTGGPASPGRAAQTRNAANSKQSGPFRSAAAHFVLGHGGCLHTVA